MRVLLRLLFFIFCCFVCTDISAQSPPRGINYQAIARNVLGKPIDSAVINVQFVIYDSIVAGNVLFTENHQSVVTNRYGLFTLVIGSNNQLLFNAINWGVGNKFLEVGIDSGGLGFVLMPRVQMMSVPYSFHSATASLATASVSAQTANQALTAAHSQLADSSSSSWSLNGNNTASANFLGTKNGNPLIFKTTNIERMRILSGGNVGIGTTTPSALLHVAGQVKITDGSEALGWVLTSDANGLASWAMPPPPYIPGNGLYLTGGSSTLNTYWSESGGNLFNNNAGNVGINNSAPSEKLDVDGTIKISGTTANELNRAQTGPANLVPIAYASVSQGGVLNAANTGNFSYTNGGGNSFWDSGNSRYKIRINGETFSTQSYVALVTIINNNAKAEVNADGNGNLLVSFWDPSGLFTIQSAFFVVVYKP